MDFPIMLKQKLEEKINGLSSGMLKNISSSISDRYRTQSGNGKSLVEGDMQALVYSMVRMPATFGAVGSALEQTLQVLGDVKISDLLDVGAGTGAASWAVDSLVDLQKITCIEREIAMLRLGKELMCCGSEVLKKAEWTNADLNDTKLDLSADLVVASYVMNEMTQDNRRSLVKRLWTASKKVLLIVEPGTPTAYKQLMDTRDILIKEGGVLLAPCPHNERCRLGDNDWCHFSTRIQRSKMHKLIKEGDVPYEDEKFFYMAFAKQDVFDNSSQLAIGKINTENKVFDDNKMDKIDNIDQLKSNDENKLTQQHNFACQSHDTGRVLRRPYIEKGQISLQLCTPRANISKTIRKKDGDLYKTAKKCKWGDLISLE